MTVPAAPTTTPVPPRLAVLFDMDGVLIDSVALNWQAYNHILAERYGVQVPAGDLYRYVGRALDDQLVLLNKRFGLTIDIPAFIAESDRLKRALFASVAPKPGVPDLLKRLQAARVPLAVGTSAARAAAADHLTKAGIQSFFQAVITEEDVRAHKPQPDVYRAAAAALHASPACCVVVEDAPNGVAAARQAGMACIAVSTPYVPLDTLGAADRVVGSLEGLTADDFRAVLRRPS